MSKSSRDLKATKNHKELSLDQLSKLVKNSHPEGQEEVVLEWIKSTGQKVDVSFLTALEQKTYPGFAWRVFGNNLDQMSHEVFLKECENLGSSIGDNSNGFPYIANKWVEKNANSQPLEDVLKIVKHCEARMLVNEGKTRAEEALLNLMKKPESKSQLNAKNFSNILQFLTNIDAVIEALEIGKNINGLASVGEKLDDLKKYDDQKNCNHIKNEVISLCDALVAKYKVIEVLSSKYYGRKKVEDVQELSTGKRFVLKEGNTENNANAVYVSQFLREIFLKNPIKVKIAGEEKTFYVPEVTIEDNKQKQEFLPGVSAGEKDVNGKKIQGVVSIDSLKDAAEIGAVLQFFMLGDNIAHNIRIDNGRFSIFDFDNALMFGNSITSNNGIFGDIVRKKDIPFNINHVFDILAIRHGKSDVYYRIFKEGKKPSIPEVSKEVWGEFFSGLKAGLERIKETINADKINQVFESLSGDSRKDGLKKLFLERYANLDTNIAFLSEVVAKNVVLKVGNIEIKIDQSIKQTFNSLKKGSEKELPEQGFVDRLLAVVNERSKSYAKKPTTASASSSSNSSSSSSSNNSTSLSSSSSSPSSLHQDLDKLAKEFQKLPLGFVDVKLVGESFVVRFMDDPFDNNYSLAEQIIGSLIVIPSETPNDMDNTKNISFKKTDLQQVLENIAQHNRPPSSTGSEPLPTDTTIDPKLAARAPIKPARVEEGIEMTNILPPSSLSKTPVAAVDKVSELRKFVNDLSCNKNDKLVTTLEKLIDDNKANPNPTSPYRGAGLKVEIAREGDKVTGLEIKEVFSPENSRFYDSVAPGAQSISLDLEGCTIIAFDCSASHKKISALFEEQPAPGDAAKKIAEYFHQPNSIISFEIENKEGERKIIYCDNTKNKTAIFVPEVVKSAVSSKNEMDVAQAQSTKWSSLSSILEKNEQKAIAIIQQKDPSHSLHQPSATQTQSSNQKKGRG